MGRRKTGAKTGRKSGGWYAKNKYAEALRVVNEGLDRGTYTQRQVYELGVSLRRNVAPLAELFRPEAAAGTTAPQATPLYGIVPRNADEEKIVQEYHARERRKKKMGGRALTPLQVIEIHRYLKDNPGASLKEDVADHLKISGTTAYKWVRWLKEIGLQYTKTADQPLQHLPPYKISTLPAGTAQKYGIEPRDESEVKLLEAYAERREKARGKGSAMPPQDMITIWRLYSSNPRLTRVFIARKLKKYHATTIGNALKWFGEIGLSPSATPLIPPATQAPSPLDLASIYGVSPRDANEKKILEILHACKRKKGKPLAPHKVIMIWREYAANPKDSAWNIAKRLEFDYSTVCRYIELFTDRGIRATEAQGEQFAAPTQKPRKGWINFTKAGVFLDPSDTKQLEIAFGIYGLKLGLSEEDLLQSGVINSSNLEGLRRVNANVAAKYGKDTRGIGAAITYGAPDKAKEVFGKLNDIARQKKDGTKKTPHKFKLGSIDLSDMREREKIAALYALLQGFDVGEIISEGWASEENARSAQALLPRVKEVYDDSSHLKFGKPYTVAAKNSISLFSKKSPELQILLEKIRVKALAKQPRDKKEAKAKLEILDTSEDFSDWLNFNKAGLHLDPRDPKHRALATGLYALAQKLNPETIFETGIIDDAMLKEVEKRYGALNSQYDRKSIARIISTFANNGPPLGAKQEFFDGAKYLKGNLEKVQHVINPPKEPRAKKDKAKSDQPETAIRFKKIGLTIDAGTDRGRQELAAIYAMLNKMPPERILQEKWADKEAVEAAQDYVVRMEGKYNLKNVGGPLRRWVPSQELRKKLDDIREAAMPKKEEKEEKTKGEPARVGARVEVASPSTQEAKTLGSPGFTKEGAEAGTSADVPLLESRIAKLTGLDSGPLPLAPEEVFKGAVAEGGPVQVAEVGAAEVRHRVTKTGLEFCFPGEGNGRIHISRDDLPVFARAAKGVPDKVQREKLRVTRDKLKELKYGVLRKLHERGLTKEQILAGIREAESVFVSDTGVDSKLPIATVGRRDDQFVLNLPSKKFVKLLHRGKENMETLHTDLPVVIASLWSNRREEIIEILNTWGLPEENVNRALSFLVAQNIQVQSDDSTVRLRPRDALALARFLSKTEMEKLRALASHLEMNTGKTLAKIIDELKTAALEQRDDSE